MTDLDEEAHDPATPDGGGELVVCPTPIGNLDDLTRRSEHALRTADVVACEDTRRTGQLLAHLGIRQRLVSLHEHNEDERSEALAQRVRQGETVVLVSDAGTPTISDPGYPLIRAVIEAGGRVTVLPGASAAVVAVVASGLALARWTFVGFLPRSPDALARELGRPEPLVAFESPRRLAGTLELLATLEPERPIAVCRELTKTHEEVVRGTAAEVAQQFAQRRPLGEIVLVVGHGRPAGRVAQGAEAVSTLVAAGAKARPAAAVVAELTGERTNAVYRAWLDAQHAPRRRNVP